MSSPGSSSAGGALLLRSLQNNQGPAAPMDPDRLKAMQLAALLKQQGK